MRYTRDAFGRVFFLYENPPDFAIASCNTHITITGDLLATLGATETDIAQPPVQKLNYDTKTLDSLINNITVPNATDCLSQ